MLKRLIIFLIRRRLGLKKYQRFRFVNQKSNVDFFYFTETHIEKSNGFTTEKSNVSLNWLLDNECEIRTLA